MKTNDCIKQDCIHYSQNNGICMKCFDESEYKKKDKFQFLSWWPEWKGLWLNTARKAHKDYAMIFKWTVGLGFWGIRKWNNDPEEVKKKLLEKMK